jgi:hypothetical protein
MYDVASKLIFVCSLLQLVTCMPRWSRLLKQYLLITVYHLPTKENTFLF